MKRSTASRSSVTLLPAGALGDLACGLVREVASNKNIVVLALRGRVDHGGPRGARLVPGDEFRSDVRELEVPVLLQSVDAEGMRVSRLFNQSEWTCSPHKERRKCDVDGTELVARVERPLHLVGQFLQSVNKVLSSLFLSIC